MDDLNSRLTASGVGSPKLPFRIRAAGAADAEALARLKHAEEDRTYWEYGTPGEHARGLLDFCSPEYVENLLLRDGTVFVAEQDSEPVGMVACGLEADHVWLNALYVSEKGAGIGKQLIATTAHYAEAQGRHAVRCEIFERNGIARRVFERFGFVRTGASRPSQTYSGVTLHEYVADAANILVVAKSR